MARAKIELSGDADDLVDYVNAFHTSVDVNGFYQELRRVWKWGCDNEYGETQEIYDLFHEYLGHFTIDFECRKPRKKSKIKARIAKTLLRWL